VEGNKRRIGRNIEGFGVSGEKERCANPFSKKKCGDTDIVLYITGTRIPICRSCAKKIDESDIEWDSNDTIKTLLKKYKHYSSIKK
jgi:hypothetical protein